MPPGKEAHRSVFHTQHGQIIDMELCLPPYQVDLLGKTLTEILPQLQEDGRHGTHGALPAFMQQNSWGKTSQDWPTSIIMSERDAMRPELCCMTRADHRHTDAILFSRHEVHEGENVH